jgi:hypothetical protein
LDSGKEGLVGYVERHLLPDERVLYKTRLHWILLAKPALLLAASLIAIGWSWRMEAPRAVLYLEAAVAGVGFLWALVRYIEMMTSEFAATSVRLILKVGLIARYTTELSISKWNPSGSRKASSAACSTSVTLRSPAPVAPERSSSGSKTPSPSAITCRWRRFRRTAVGANGA